MEQHSGVLHPTQTHTKCFKKVWNEGESEKASLPTKLEIILIKDFYVAAESREKEEENFSEYNTPLGWFFLL